MTPYPTTGAARASSEASESNLRPATLQDPAGEHRAGRYRARANRKAQMLANPKEPGEPLILNDVFAKKPPMIRRGVVVRSVLGMGIGHGPYFCFKI